MNGDGVKRVAPPLSRPASTLAPAPVHDRHVCVTDRMRAGLGVMAWASALASWSWRPTPGHLAKARKVFPVSAVVCAELGSCPAAKPRAAATCRGRCPTPRQSSGPQPPAPACPGHAAALAGQPAQRADVAAGVAVMPEAPGRQQAQGVQHLLRNAPRSAASARTAEAGDRLWWQRRVPILGYGIPPGQNAQPARRPLERKRHQARDGTPPAGDHHLLPGFHLFQQTRQMGLGFVDVDRFHA